MVSSKCGWRAKIVNVASSQSVEVTVRSPLRTPLNAQVVDVCTGDECGGRDDLILSIGAFDALLGQHDDADSDGTLTL